MASETDAFSFYLRSVLEAREVIVLAFAKNEDALADKKAVLEKELFTKKLSTAIEKLADRYILVVKHFPPAKKQELLSLLAVKYPKLFILDLAENTSAKKQPQKQALQTLAKEKQNWLYWAAFVLVGVGFLLWFFKEFATMLKLRRSQKSIKQQQLKMEQELKGM